MALKFAQNGSVNGSINGSIKTSLNPPISDWGGKVVWIIGAGSGIGLHTAQFLVEKGATVWASGRDATKLAAFTHSLALDATDPAALERGFNTLLHRAGRLDVLLYCAGHYEPLSVFEHTIKQIDAHVATNYLGAAYAVHTVLNALRSQGFGHISLVASVAGYSGLPRAMAYGSSKAALQHMAQTLYLELHPLGVGVSVVNPGFVKTALTAKNNFPMPFMMDANSAARLLVKGLERGQFEISFPTRFVLILKLLQLLPHRLYFYLIRRTTRHV